MKYNIMEYEIRLWLKMKKGNSRQFTPRVRLRDEWMQAGSIALYLVMVISLLLMTATVLGARLSMSETRQSSDVDQSNAAYYAAEAGVEEASRRLDINREDRLTLQDIFPEQYRSGVQHGDRAQLLDGNGNSNLGGGFDINLDPRDDHSKIIGDLAWRQRRVYEEPRAPIGTLVKDETVEVDATELRRQCDGGYYAGEDGDDCKRGTSIFSNFEGLEFCWNSSRSARMEFTVLSYRVDSPQNVDTDKFISSGRGGTQHGDYIRLENAVGASNVYDNCVELELKSKNRRYIFRTRPLFTQDEAQDQDEASQFRADYRTRLLDSSDQSRPLFVPDDTVLIDVVGQSGDVRRRIIARKNRQGRILGIFDYVLYSGDQETPLCKVGVQQATERNRRAEVPGVEYDLDHPQCEVTPADNEGEFPEADPDPEPQPATTTITMRRNGKDTFVASNRQSRNFHRSSELHVTTSANGSRRYMTRYSYLRFPLNKIPDSANIKEAELKLVQTSTSSHQSDTVRIRARRMDVDWNHKTINWHSREWGSGIPSPGYTNVPYNPGSTAEWDVTEIVKSWHTGRYNNYGFVLAVTNPGSDDGRFFHSSNNSRNRPKLEVTYE